MPRLNDRDQDAVFALLVRQVEAQDAKAAAQKDLEDALQGKSTPPQ